MFSPIIASLDFITKYFKTIVLLTIMYFIIVPSDENLVDSNIHANLQKIELSGPIMDVSKTLEDIQKAKEDKNIKGILFVVNSKSCANSTITDLSKSKKD